MPGQPSINGVQKVDLELHSGRNTDEIALNVSNVKINNEPYWLVAAVERDTHAILHIWLYFSRNTD